MMAHDPRRMPTVKRLPCAHRNHVFDGWYGLPARAIREQMAGAVELICQVSRMRDGTR